MAATRKTVSIHDYPEHLNPFSDSTTPIGKGKMLANRLSKSGTWSSKITKRVNRSVTWIEKSWLGIEDSRKYNISPDKTFNGNRDITNNATPRRITENISRAENSSNSSEKDDSKCQRVRERIGEIIVNPNEDTSTRCEEERNEIKKKKKRPAPLPPRIIADTYSSDFQKASSEPDNHNISNEKNEQMENCAALSPSSVTNSCEESALADEVEPTSLSSSGELKKDEQSSIHSTSESESPSGVEKILLSSRESKEAHSRNNSTLENQLDELNNELDNDTFNRPSLTSDSDECESLGRDGRDISKSSENCNSSCELESREKQEKPLTEDSSNNHRDDDKL